MKIAYLILAHGRPRQLGRLVAALPSESPIFIHFDKRADILVFEEARRSALNANSSTAFVKRHACRWARLASCTRRSNSSPLFAIQANNSIMRRSLGQDYPIKSKAVIESDLSRAASSSNASHCSLPIDGATTAAISMRRRASMAGTSASGLASGALARDDCRAISRRSGAQWWSLSRKAVEYLNCVNREDRRLVRALGGSFVRTKCCADDPRQLGTGCRHRPGRPAVCYLGSPGTILSGDFNERGPASARRKRQTFREEVRLRRASAVLPTTSTPRSGLWVTMLEPGERCRDGAGDRLFEIARRKVSEAKGCTEQEGPLEVFHELSSLPSHVWLSTP